MRLSAWTKTRAFLAAAAAAIVTLAATPAAAAAKTYSADRFDVRVRVLAGGALEIVETVVFRFESGTFDHVTREISTRRTDGLEIVGATMDGRAFPVGDGPGHVAVNQGSRVRVRWQFQPVADSTHTFVLTYVARGVVWQEGKDVLAWRALPDRHDYRIASSTVVFELPGTVAGAAGAPLPTLQVERHGIEGAVDSATTRANDDSATAAVLAQATARDVRPNGWIEARMDLPAGSLVSAPPDWQRSAAEARALAPRWITAAALILGAGLIMLFGLRQRYDAPPPDARTVVGFESPPDALPAGLAGPLVSGGFVTMEHAMAAVLDLAGRGVLAIVERPKGVFSQQKVALRRLPGSHVLAPYEQTLLDIGLDNLADGEGTPLESARRRLIGQFRRYRTAVRTSLQSAGLLDPERASVRSRFGRMAGISLLLAGVGFLSGIPFVERFGGWLFVVPAAFVAVAAISAIFAASTTGLSNEGLRSAARWKGFQAYLKGVGQDKYTAPSGSLDQFLAFAVGLGLAASWGKLLKRHPGSVPPWFRALSPASQNSAFTAFVVSSGTSHGGAAGAGAGAAGGGSSSAG